MRATRGDKKLFKGGGESLYKAKPFGFVSCIYVEHVALTTTISSP